MVKLPEITSILVLTLVCSRSIHASPVAKSHNENCEQQADQGGGAHNGFRLTRMANGVSKNGAPFSQNTLERGPGEKVNVIVTRFVSAEAVRKEFADLLSSAKQVIEHKAFAAGNGATEDRAVLSVSDKRGESMTVILTTSGRKLHEIQAYVAQTALEFEKQTRASERDEKH